MEKKCENCSCVDKDLELVKKYEGQPSELIRCLQEIQTSYGYIPERMAGLVAKHLTIPESDVYAVITFYKQFTLRPRAKHVIEVCLGTACYVLGAQKLIDETKKILKLTDKKYTEDGKFEIVESRCLGCCGIAPAISVDGKLHGHVKPEQMRKILSECE